ncbi:hypothetical protein [Sporisorium scitamineum]|uniref:Uncharacterized protein n=1 Tax=Sporisorium scitamineum TaxID=49012 RepID=A0A0F7S5Q4_9BASI|nr:hypothetical protein [Sporisorium scitamineum]
MPPFGQTWMHAQALPFIPTGHSPNVIAGYIYCNVVNIFFLAMNHCFQFTFQGYIFGTGVPVYRLSSCYQRPTLLESPGSLTDNLDDDNHSSYGDFVPMLSNTASTGFNTSALNKTDHPNQQAAISMV